MKNWKAEYHTHDCGASVMRITENGHCIVPEVGSVSLSAKQTMANANLIAAAPELLEALKSAKRVLESGNLESQDAEETAIEILEAIAKAEGRDA